MFLISKYHNARKSSGGLRRVMASKHTPSRQSIRTLTIPIINCLECVMTVFTQKHVVYLNILLFSTGTEITRV